MTKILQTLQMKMAEPPQRPLPKIRGLRHVALHVTDRARSQAFYQNLFQMRVVWQPDEQSVYLSSGVDNVALHQIAEEDREQYHARGAQFLDHIGILMDSAESVDELYQLALSQGVTIVKHPKRHRDGSYSFYMADPDRITIQVLFEPIVSPLQFEMPVLTHKN